MKSSLLEAKRLETIQNDFKKYSFGLMIFTAIVALGTLISAWFFAIEIYKYYFSIPAFKQLTVSDSSNEGLSRCARLMI